MIKINGAAIRRALLDKKLSLRQMSKQSGLHAKTCRRLVDGKAGSFRVIGTAAAYLGLNADDLIIGRDKVSN